MNLATSIGANINIASNFTEIHNWSVGHGF